MSIQHVGPGEAIHLALGPALATTKTSTLFKTADLDVIRLVLPAGQLLYLSAAKPHAVQAINDSVLLVTMLLSKIQHHQRRDVVQEASVESFPASDAPAW